jgi:hypothetical protein
MIGSPAVRVAIVSFDRSFGLLPASAKLTVATNTTSVATAAGATLQTALHLNLAIPIIWFHLLGSRKQRLNRFQEPQRPSE